MSYGPVLGRRARLRRYPAVDDAQRPDLLITGGTVVTATGSRRADVAITGGTIAAVEPDLGGLRASAREIDRRDRAARAAGRGRRPHPHARRDRRRAGPLLPGFGRRRVRRHDDVPRVQQPGDGLHRRPAERSLMTGVRRVAGRDRRRQRHRLRAQPRDERRDADDPIAELPATVEAGVATSKAFMVFDFRLPDAALFEAMRTMGERGGMLEVHCEDPVLLDAAIADALQRGDVSPRYHATTRPPYVEAVATGACARVRPRGGRTDARRPPLVARRPSTRFAEPRRRASE